MKFDKILGIGTILLTTLSSPVLALERENQEQEPSQVEVREIAESSVGKVGQRQTRDETQTHIKPMARIDNRVANRVQNRIGNRLDRYYNPQVNATSPFEVAEDQARKAGAQNVR